jgi:prephenate dehydratase
MSAPVGANATRARPRYTVLQMLEIVRFACERFHVARSSIFLWTTQETTLLRSIGAYNNGGGDIDRAANSTTIATDTTVFAPPHIREQPIIVARAPAPTRTEGVEETQVSSISDETTSSTAYGNRSSMHDMTTSTIRMESPSTASTPAITAGVILVGYNGADCGFACTAAQRTFTQAVSTRGSSTATFTLTGYPQASHVLDALRKHEIDLAFVATDLLLSNIHHAALNQMVAFRLKMVGEVVAEEDVNVCALPGTELCDADSVVSDWRTLQRYEEYIVQLEMQYNRTIYRQVAWDSSAGCRLVKEEEAEKTLVLCTASAAVNHGLVVLQRRLPGSPTHTRYTIIGRYGTSSLEFGGATIIPVEGALYSARERHCARHIGHHQRFRIQRPRDPIIPYARRRGTASVRDR